ncbi:MAG: hypothetical protein HKP27_16250, partial [Myxococcales bacterium]|nr:hypothetical protein [Myxococcales bacterium]
MNANYALLQSIDEPGLVVDAEGAVLCINPSFRRRIVVDGPVQDPVT